MATKLQWVNFPEADGTIGTTNVTRSNLVDGDVTSVEVMSRKVLIAVKFKKKEFNRSVTLTMTPDGGNAKYSASEKAGAAGIFAPGTTASSKIGIRGVAKFAVYVTPAGGDKFSFKAKSSKGTEISLSDQIETRRKLYYQVIRMRRARRLSGAMLSRFEQQFWKEPKKAYIKLEQYGAGQTIRNRVNFNDEDPAVLSAVRNAARAVYDGSKAPFAVAALIVNKNCIPGPEVGSLPVNVHGQKVQVVTNDPLFQFADPVVAWFHGMTFNPAGGVAISIAIGAIRVVDQSTLEVDTAALPAGAGTLDYNVTVVKIVGMGLSLPTENLVTIASRDLDGGKVPANTMAAILTHEVGHKIGMVPGPQGDHDLDQQPFYYDGRGHSGPHCRNPAPAIPNYMDPNAPPLVPKPKCTMFGDIRTNTSVFCSKCIKSVRKLDVSPSRKPGIATQF